MPEPSRLRVVGEGEPPARRRRGPGPAVLLVLLYALAFAAALVLLWSQTRHGRDRRPHTEPRAAAPLTDRKALAAGEGLRPAERDEYLRALSREHCDCGCGRTLQNCLTMDQKCSRSPELAVHLRRTGD